MGSEEFDLGRIYACQFCSKPVEEVTRQLNSLTIACNVASTELYTRRVKTATSHVRLLDAKNQGRCLTELLNQEFTSLYLMMKRMAFLSLLNDIYADVFKTLKRKTITRNACLHRYEQDSEISSRRIPTGSMVITDGSQIEV